MNSIGYTRFLSILSDIVHGMKYFTGVSADKFLLNLNPMNTQHRQLLVSYKASKTIQFPVRLSDKYINYCTLRQLHFPWCNQINTFWVIFNVVHVFGLSIAVDDAPTPTTSTMSSWQVDNSYYSTLHDASLYLQSSCCLVIYQIETTVHYSWQNTIGIDKKG